jgi:hypothetical protein
MSWIPASARMMSFQVTTGLCVGAGISCVDDEIFLIDACASLHRCNLFGHTHDQT